MPNEQLIAHIRTEFARGIDRAVVIRSLLTAGWKVEDINASIAVVDSGQNQNIPATSSIPVPPVQSSYSSAQSSIKTGSMKTIYLLMYGVPALIIGFVNIGSLRSAIDLLGNPYAKFWGNVWAIAFPLVFIFLAGIYMFWAFSQNRINKYTNWSVLSFYVGVLIYIVIGFILGASKSEATAFAFAMWYIMYIILGGVMLSVVCAHITGLIKNSLNPKSLHLVFIIFTLATAVGFITYNYFPSVPSNLSSNKAASVATYPVGENVKGIAFDNVTNSVWVTSRNTSTAGPKGLISKVNINDGTKIDYVIGLDEASDPVAATFDNVTNSVWVADYGDNIVSKVNINTGAKIDYGTKKDFSSTSSFAHPRSIAFDNVTNSVWVVNELSGNVVKVNINTGATTAYVAGSDPRDIAFDPATKSVWITHLGSNMLSKINVDTGAKSDYSLGHGLNSVTFDNVTNSIWVTSSVTYGNVSGDTTVSNSVSKVNVVTGTKTDYPVAIDPYGITFDNVTNSVWVTSWGGVIGKVNINDGTRTDYTSNIANNSQGVTFDNVTNSVWIANGNSVTKVSVK